VNLTLSLLTGLVLLLPGLTAIVAWNGRGARAAARRPDLPLTALSALFASVAVAAVVHGIGYALGEVAVRATDEFGLHSPLIAPYPVVIDLIFGARSPLLRSALFEFLLVTLIACVAVARAVLSAGLDLVLSDVDARGQGWVFEHVVRPRANGYVPIAYVFTNMVSDGVGIGYQGPIAEIRQTEDGKVRTIAIGQPQRFLYELRSGEQPSGRSARARRGAPRLIVRGRRWLGGVVALDGDVVRNIVVRNLSDAELDAER
jgi:hypothetical protein